MLTIACPHCGTVVNVDNQTPVGCEVCHDAQHTLYTLRADGKTMTLCLPCIQKQMWRVVPPVFTVGPTEVK